MTHRILAYCGFTLGLGALLLAAFTVTRMSANPDLFLYFIVQLVCAGVLFVIASINWSMR